MAALISASTVALPILPDFDLGSFAGTKAAGTKAAFTPLMAVGGPKNSSSTAGITKATKLLKSGKAKKAAALLSKIISGGKLTPSDMATALHYRGVALRKQGKPAQAIADFTNALWLKNGLPAGLRVEAAQQRAAAKRDAGIANGVAAPQPRRTAARGRPAAPAAANRGWQTQTQAAAPTAVARRQIAAKPRQAANKKPANSGIGGFFSNLFSSGTKSAKPTTATGSLPAPATRPAVRQPRPSAGRVTQVSGWSSQTAVRPARRAPAPTQRAVNRRIVRKTVVATAPPAGAVRVTRPQNRRPTAKRSARAVYRLILSPVRSPEVAQANALKVKRQFANVLAQRQPVIETTTFGGGTFYQVRIGPFADAASPRSMCAKLKAGGVDCMLAKQ